MRTRLLIGLATVLLSTVPVAAHADGPGWVGTCRILRIAGLPAEVHIDVVVSTPGDTIVAASCWAKANASSGESKILDGVVHPGGAAATGRGPYQGADEYLCTHVTTIRFGIQDVCAVA